MIGNGAISSYGTHTHEHTVTKCLHETYDMKSKSGAAMSGGAGMAAEKTAGWRQENFSFADFWSGGWKGFVSKSFELLGKVWNGGQDAGKGAGRSAVWQAAVYGTENVSAEKSGQTAGVSVPAEALAAAAVREQPEARRGTAGTGRGAVPQAESISGGMADHSKDAAGGRTWKKQAQVRKFFQQFGKNAAETGRIGDAQGETEKEDGGSAERNAMDFAVGDSSYLLDSYNRSGEYSTLAKDRSLEGKFRAMG